jgi:hypothetical protein
VLVKAKRNSIVEFSNDGLTLCLIIAIAIGMPGANITEVLGKGLAEVRRGNPNLVEDTKRTTKLVEILGVTLERVGRAHS